MYSLERLKTSYKTMLKIRLCEESMVEPILDGVIKTPVHLCSGQEAVAVGVCSCLEKNDYVFGNHRSHGHYLAKGGSLEQLVAEVYCRQSGCSAGRGGSMHLIDPENGMMGAAPIVAGTVSLAVGAALSAKLRKNGRLAVSFFGDGAVGEGVFHESLNFASLKQLPILFVCENNLYATHMSIAACRPQRPISDLAAPFGILGEQVDGNNIMKVFETVERVLERCRQGKGPVLLECLTYRLHGHVGPDDNVFGQHYDIRPGQEVAEWQSRDPIIHLERYLLDNGFVDKTWLCQIRSALEEKIQRAHELARQGPEPDQEQLASNLFAD